MSAVTRFEQFFSTVTGHEPYPYQERLAAAEWPDILDVPTGLGKTAAVTLAWAWKRGLRPGGQRGDVDPATPRRLVWCLPMRTLVEQTAENVRQWLARLGWLAGEDKPDGGVAVHVLMGGEDDLTSWTRYPDAEQILIGTQDMLLSRALMRGYGMSRYLWPVHFALLHNDALWVFDEVQLMGPGLPTSTQLEAFRRSFGTAAPSRSLWVSATLDESWLDTVDFRSHRQAGLARHTLSDADQTDERARRRLSAPKALARAQAALDAETAKAQAKAYIEALAAEILAAHVPGEQTLVILNRVDRAQALYRTLAGNGGPDCLLLHARFRPRERRSIEQRLREPVGAAGRIVVATQAVEAGVDIDSRVLFTELAPWASLVQRFGRCNRAGRFDAAQVYWMDIDAAGKDLALPYSAESLAAAREILSTLQSVSPAGLPPVSERPEAGLILRRRDLLELFNTDPDLSGFDIDVSPYIRDTGAAQAQVFWRDIGDRPEPDEPAPDRDELCPVSLQQLREHLKKDVSAWRLDTLAKNAARWIKVDAEAIRPGQTYMLAASQGGYLPAEGFVPRNRTPVEPVPQAAGKPAETYDSDYTTAIGRWIRLPDHLAHVARVADALCRALGLDEAGRRAVTTAARWHDVGKAHEAFVRGIGATPDDPQGPWAKSEGSGRPDYHVVDGDGERLSRPYFRHELASMLAWLAHGDPDLPGDERDLIAYLIAAHHGKVRMGLRALPGEKEPPEPDRLFARGVWDGDRLPALGFDGIDLPETQLRLGLMQLGEGPQGPSWTARTQRLLQLHGPFRLAWLEALVRIADWRASAAEQAQASDAA